MTGSPWQVFGRVKKAIPPAPPSPNPKSCYSLILHSFFIFPAHSISWDLTLKTRWNFPPKIVVTSLNSHPHQPTHSLILDLRRTILRSLQKLGNTQASCYLTNKMMFFGGTCGFNCWLLNTFVFRSYHPSKPIYILRPLIRPLNEICGIWGGINSTAWWKPQHYT